MKTPPDENEQVITDLIAVLDDIWQAMPDAHLPEIKQIAIELSDCMEAHEARTSNTPSIYAAALTLTLSTLYKGLLKKMREESVNKN